jgi:beta-N-acetylhexosaminidase
MRAIALLCCFLLISPATYAQRAKPKRGKEARPVDWVADTMGKMTLDEKVGQLLVPSLTSSFMNNASESFLEIARNIQKFHAGGYHAFGGDPLEVASILNRAQKLAKVPLLITADLEGGPGYQFRGATRLPRAMVMGAAGDEQLAYEAGKLTAVEGRAMGIVVNFYPVVDVNNNPRNPIINIRSFGEDPALVSRMAAAYIRGAQENGQVATAKHFPGHGDTAQDSHIELAVIDATRERLDQVELPPFRAAIATGVGAVMTAHMAVPQVEPEKDLPATLSKMMNTDVLRGELGFQGLLFTDAMTMRGISVRFTPEEATVRAVKAGADLILHPPSVEKSFNALKAAVESGDIPLERIEASVRRILEYKRKMGLDKNRLVDLDKIPEIVGSPAHLDTARTITERGVTLARDERRALPLKPDPAQTVLCLNILDSRGGWREGLPGRVFCSEVTRRHSNTIEVTIDDSTPKEALEILKKLARASDVIVVGGFVRVAAYRGTIDLTDNQVELLRSLSQMERPFVFGLFGVPYLLSHVPELPSYILAFEYTPDAERAVVRAIWGEIPFTGKLPVSLPGAYPIGHGLSAPVAP